MRGFCIERPIATTQLEVLWSEMMNSVHRGNPHQQCDLRSYGPCHPVLSSHQASGVPLYQKQLQLRGHRQRRSVHRSNVQNPSLFLAVRMSDPATDIHTDTSVTLHHVIDSQTRLPYRNPLTSSNTKPRIDLDVYWLSCY
jgi:hypothetical protein